MKSKIVKIVTLSLGMALAVGASATVMGDGKATPLFADGDISITFPNNPSTKTNSYTSSFTQTHEGIVFTFSGWNNGANNNSWTEIRGGRSGAAWTGTITNGSAISSKVGSIDVTITSLSACNGSSLTVASDSSFTSNVQTVSKLAGDMSVSTLTYTVPNPAQNQFYKLTFNQTASANGSIRVSQIDFNYLSSANLSSISLGGDYQTDFYVGNQFNHDGMTVTAHYDDSTSKDVTSSAVWSSPNMASSGEKTVTVSYTESGITKSAEYTIDVIAGVPATSIELSSSSGTLLAGKQATLTATCQPAGTTDEVIWSSSDNTVATVEDGVITTLKVGNATITATAGSVHADYSLTVVSATSAQNFIGAKIDRVGVLIAKNGKNAIIDDGYGGIWAFASTDVTQSEGAIVRVTGTSKVYSSGLEVDGATIESVEGSVTPVSASPLTIDEATTYFTNHSNNVENFFVPTRKVSLRTGVVGGSGTYLTWDYAGHTMETNYLTGGMETGKEYDVEGYIFKFYNEYLVIVVTKADVVKISATDIELSEHAISLEAGESKELVATLEPDGASDNVVWTSSDSSIASVSGGNVTAVAAGNATITAFADANKDGELSNGEVYDECSVTVTAAPVFELIEKFDFESDLTGYKAYNASEMDAFIAGSSSLGANTKYAGHDITGSATNPLIGANGTINSVSWSNYDMLKLGSTSNNTTMKLIFENGTAISKVVVKAAGWAGKVCYLAINGSEPVRITSATTGASIEDETAFSNYVYRLNTPSKEITLQTTLAIMISELEIYAIEGAGPIEPTAAEKIADLDTKASLSYTYDKNSSNTASDLLNNAFTGVGTTNNYASWSNKKGSSGAVYAGQSAGGNSTIQLRSNNSNSGVINTASNGKATKVIITWNSGTAATREVSVYGKNSAYSSPANLYSNDAGVSGELIDTVSIDDAVNYVSEVIIPNDENESYEFIGIRSVSGALYLDSIEVQWAGEFVSYNYPTLNIRFGGYVSQALWNELDTENHLISEYGILLSTSQFLGSAKLETKFNSIDNSNVKKFSYSIPGDKDHPTPADVGDVEGLDEPYYIWNLRKGVSMANITKEFVALAYVVVDGEVVFLNEVKASVKSLAQDLIDDETNEYNANSFEGSLGYLANY